MPISGPLSVRRHSSYDLLALLALIAGVVVDLFEEPLGMGRGVPTVLGLLLASTVYLWRADKVLEQVDARLQKATAAPKDYRLARWMEVADSDDHQYSKQPGVACIEVEGRRQVERFFFEAALAVENSWACTCPTRHLHSTEGGWLENIFAYQNRVAGTVPDQSVYRLYLEEPGQAGEAAALVKDFQNRFDDIKPRILRDGQGRDGRQRLSDLVGDEDLAIVDLKYVLVFKYGNEGQSPEPQRIQCFYDPELVRRVKSVFENLWALGEKPR